jgi:hypothetical protein
MGDECCGGHNHKHDEETPVVAPEASSEETKEEGNDSNS